MSDDHAEPLLDSEPSWVMAASGASASGGSGPPIAGASPWDQAAARTMADEAPAGRGGGGNGGRPPEEADADDLPKVVLFVRLANMGAAALLIFGSVAALSNILSLSKMILGGYGFCFGVLVCCLEIDLSFLRRPIAANFGFLYQPCLRLLFYVLMGMVSWSFESLIGVIACAALGLLALINTYVLCRYPRYRAALREISDEQQQSARREGRKRAWRYGALPWWEV